MGTLAVFAFCAVIFTATTALIVSSQREAAHLPDFHDTFPDDDDLNVLRAYRAPVRCVSHRWVPVSQPLTVRVVWRWRCRDCGAVSTMGPADDEAPSQRVRRP